jgi:hypothetical protein
MKAEGRKEVLQSDTKRLRIEGAVTCKDVFPLGCDQHRSIDLIEINEEAELGKRSHSHPIQLRLDLQIDLHLGKDTNFALHQYSSQIVIAFGPPSELDRDVATPFRNE